MYLLVCVCVRGGGGGGWGVGSVSQSTRQVTTGDPRNTIFYIGHICFFVGNKRGP